MDRNGSQSSGCLMKFWMNFLRFSKFSLDVPFTFFTGFSPSASKNTLNLLPKITYRSCCTPTCSATHKSQCIPCSICNLGLLSAWSPARMGTWPKGFMAPVSCCSLLSKFETHVNSMVFVASFVRSVTSLNSCFLTTMTRFSTYPDHSSFCSCSMSTCQSSPVCSTNSIKKTSKTLTWSVPWCSRSCPLTTPHPSSCPWNSFEYSQSPLPYCYQSRSSTCLLTHFAQITSLRFANIFRSSKTWAQCWHRRSESLWECRFWGSSTRATRFVRMCTACSGRQPRFSLTNLWPFRPWKFTGSQIRPWRSFHKYTKAY